MIPKQLGGLLVVESYAQEAVAALAGRMQSCAALWVLGGSTGLGMRGARLTSTPRDIDIYADAEDARRIHAHLQSWSTDAQQVSTTERYRSVLSHYAVAGATVELVGDFRIDTADSHYKTEVAQMLHPAGDSCRAGEYPVRLVPLGHELIFNILRGRQDRCELVGEMIRRQPDRHAPLLRELLVRNRLSEDDRRLACHYAGLTDDA